MLTPQLEQQLRDEFARVGGRIQTPDDLTKRLLGHGYRPRGPRRRPLALCGAGALLLLITLVVVLTGAGTASRARPGATLEGHLALRLVDDQVTLVSTESLAAAGSISAISCSAANDCIAIGAATQHTAGLVATTTDGGQNWTEQALPADLTSLSAISCSAANQCVAVGSRTGGAAIVATTDGGTTWGYLDVPNGVTSLTSVSCAADRCWAVGSGGNESALLSGSPDSAWTPSPVPSGVTALSAVGCTAGPGSPTCMAVGSASSAPSVIVSFAGAPWATVAAPPGARALASAACTNSSAPYCTTLAQEGNYWVEASGYVASPGPAGEWRVPQLLSGVSVPTGTVLAGVSSCIAIGGPPCTPSNADLVDTVTAVISSLQGTPTTPGSLNESLTSGYISSEPSFSEPPFPGHVSPVWYMGVSATGLSADEVLTPSQRMS
jgi:hypothetical protein